MSRAVVAIAVAQYKILLRQALKGSSTDERSPDHSNFECRRSRIHRALACERRWRSINKPKVGVSSFAKIEVDLCGDYDLIFVARSIARFRRLSLLAARAGRSELGRDLRNIAGVP